MSCSCHGKEKLKVEGAVKPDDQCLNCALKHINMARLAWGEFCYEETNRLWAAGHIRLAVEHIKHDYRDIALLLRDLAIDLEDVNDKSRDDISIRLLELYERIRELRAAENPEIQARLASLGEFPNVPIIIPLGSGSKSDNDELKILLRSIDKNAIGCGTVYIVTDNAPDWLDTKSCKQVSIPDTYTNCKDANLIAKTLGVIERFGLNSFCWCADDNVFCKPVVLSKIPILYNHRKREDFEAGGTWAKRVLHTFDFAEAKGIHLEYNFESHAPQYFTNAQGLLEEMKKVDYAIDGGLTIMTAFRIVQKSTEDALNQDVMKETFEKGFDNAKFDKAFIGYNDNGFYNGLRERLFQLFPNKSRFEK